jgi:hypothetical protein
MTYTDDKFKQKPSNFAKSYQVINRNEKLIVDSHITK